MNHIDNYSQKSYRNSRRKHLEHAGFLFQQNDEDKWVVLLPITSRYAEYLKREGQPPNARMNKVYKHLGTALNAAERQIKRWRLRKSDNDLPNDEANIAIEKYDTYEPDFKDIW